MRQRHILQVLLVALLAAPGCLGPRREQYESARQLSILRASTEADHLWQSAQDSLRRQHFRLDRVDRRNGIITTLPVTSQHMLEFWRHDVNTWPDLWESTLNPIRRLVEVKLQGESESSETELAVVVHKQRLSSLDRQFNSTGAAYQYFGDSLPSTTGLAKINADDDQWLDAGRDPAMEEYLLRAILRHAAVENTTIEVAPDSE